MTVMLFAGLVLLVGGLVQVWSSLRGRRRGDPAWRGTLVAAGGLVLYGALIVSGVFPGGPAVATAGVGFAAGLIFTGLVINIRDRRKAAK